MPVPRQVFDPPFNIVRCSHVALAVTDLARSRAFYEDTLGLHVEDVSTDAIYLRGVEERQHHSLVLERAAEPAARYLGFKAASEEDLDKAAHFFRSKDLPHAFVERAYQGRALRAVDPFGMPIELCYHFEKRENLLQKYGHYRGVHPQRLDQFNVFAPDVQGALDVYAMLGFRLTEYAEEDGPNGRIAAGWMHRKGNVHDLAYWAPTAMHIIHLCDLMATTGWLSSMERGPGRHGISNAFFLYVRDPDGHRVEIYTSDYQTMDPDHEPIRWSLRDPRRQTLWGQPAPRSWFEDGSAFDGCAQKEALFKADVLVAS